MKKSLKIAGIVVLAVVVVGLIVWAYMNQSGSNSMMGNSGNNLADIPEAMLEDQTAEAAQATQELINDLIESEQEMQTVQTSVAGEGVMGEDGEIIPSTEVKEIKMVVVSPGTSGINVETGKVVTATGVAVVNDVRPGSQEAPQSSFPIDVNELPKSAVKLSVTSTSFTPAEFTVNRGQAVNLAVTNANTTTFSEVFRFDDPSLKAVVLGLAKGETRSITFNAPSQAGEYTFYSDMFNHRDQGAVGKMIVK
ncbi:cupredoxin domain-containing protein [Patescibacteria group bacterium]|nr:cupredoxin domain-containing protein [Patescibacteria group bacterium]